MKRLLSTAGYMLLSFLGLTFLGYIGIVIAWLALGKVSPADLRDMVQVFGGQKRYVVPSEDYERFKEFVADEDAMRAAMVEKYGDDRTRVTAAAIELGARRDLAVEVAARQADLKQAQQTILDVRAQVESLKDQLAEERKKLSDERAKTAAVEADAMTKKTRALLAAMDTAVTATYLTKIVNEGAGAPEAARILREHVAADLGAEVLGEIADENIRQQILPLMENKFAGVAPALAVDIFRRNNMAGPEMAIYLRQMSAPQALATYLRLTDAEREQLAPLLLSSR